nr:hypothetical protein GCM10020092_056260 [Actinoplanes digitatis]
MRSPSTAELRRYYRLTSTGAAALAAQVERLRRHADAAEARLRRPRGRTAFGAVTLGVAR